MASILADRDDILNKAEEAGYLCGLAFQIQDDILDVEKNLKKEGETSSDVRNQ